MEKKKKVFLGIFLLILLMPMAGMMLAGQAPENITIFDKSIRPIGNFGLSASPVVTAADTEVTNLDDTDNIYGGGYKTYTLVVNCSDADGAGTIANMTVSFGGYFAFQWLNTTGTTTEFNGTSKVRIGTVSNTTTASGTTLNFTIAFKVEWAMDDIDDVDIIVDIYDDPGTLVSATKNCNYDFDTDLTLASTNFVSTQSVGTGGAIQFGSIVVSYEDSGGDNYPLAAETDFLMTRTPATGSTDSWSESSYTDSTGVCVFAAITAGHIAQLETYTFTTYTQGGTTTNLFGSAKTDSVNIDNSGGGGDDGPAVAPLGISQIILIGIVLGGGYLAYSIFFAGSKSSTKGRSKKKSSKRKKR